MAIKSYIEKWHKLADKIPNDPAVWTEEQREEAKKLCLRVEVALGNVFVVKPSEDEMVSVVNEKTNEQ